MSFNERRAQGVTMIYACIIMLLCVVAIELVLTKGQNK
jgi:hypothetical protein